MKKGESLAIPIFAFHSKPVLAVELFPFEIKQPSSLTSLTFKV
jgi:hypothetical protein